MTGRKKVQTKLHYNTSGDHTVFSGKPEQFIYVASHVDLGFSNACEKPVLYI